MTFDLVGPGYFEQALTEASKRGWLVRAEFVDAYNAARRQGAGERDAAIEALLAVDILPLTREGIT